jgi:hypothetical protein
MVQFNSAPATIAPRRRGPGKALAIGLVVLVALLGLGAGGVNAYAKHSVCQSLKGESDTIGGGDSGQSSDDGMPTKADLDEMRTAADNLRGYGHMLIFNGDLREAVNGFADDVDQIADLLGSAGGSATSADQSDLTKLVTIAGSMNSHAREAQKACGLPVTGIFNQ